MVYSVYPAVLNQSKIKKNGEIKHKYEAKVVF
jgi:hypothetical protein